MARDSPALSLDIVSNTLLKLLSTMVVVVAVVAGMAVMATAGMAVVAAGMGGRKGGTIRIMRPGPSRARNVVEGREGGARAEFEDEAKIRIFSFI